MKKIKKNPLGELTAVAVVVAVVFDGVVVVVVEETEFIATSVEKSQPQLT